MKYLLFLAIKSQGKKARGFTLIELLVVVIILGVLAAVGLPNLLGQVAKGREAEAIAILGQINRAQQAYRYENGTFALLERLPISDINNARFYQFRDYITPNTTNASYQALARTLFENDIRNYAGGVRLNANGSLTVTICRAFNTLQDDVFVNGSGGCSGGTEANGMGPSIPTGHPWP